MVCCTATWSTCMRSPSSRKAGKMVSIENGPNIARPASSRARRRVEGEAGVMRASVSGHAHCTAGAWPGTGGAR
ncbi:hypothetical protein D3C71_1716820 [compost metagenome]